MQYGEAYGVKVFAASAARTTNGNGGVTDVDLGAGALRAQLNVTAASGTTPTLNVLIEDSLDGTNWNTVGTFAQKTAVSREVINVTAPFVNNYLRASWTIGGTTPSFTFDVLVLAKD